MSTQQILDLVRRFADTELHGVTAAYDDLLTPDFTGIGPVGFVLNREQWALRHTTGLTTEEFAVEEPAVRLHGDVAIVTGVQRQKATARGHDAGGSFRLTLVAIRSGDRWRIDHLQLSGPLRAPTAPPPFPPAPTIGRDDLRAAIAAGTVTVVDALPAAPYGVRHLPSALNLTTERAAEDAAELLPDRTAAIVVYSTDTACTRAPELEAELRRLGYTDVRRYAEGIAGWVAAGLPTEP